MNGMKEQGKKDLPNESCLKIREGILKLHDPTTGQENNSSTTEEWHNSSVQDGFKELKHEPWELQ